MKNLDWGSLSFGYMKTDYNVRCYYRDGKWGEIEVCFYLFNVIYAYLLAKVHISCQFHNIFFRKLTFLQVFS